MKTVLVSAILMLMLSCSDSRHDLERMELIKKTGNSNPTLAIEMLDSISTEMRTKSTFVNMKYELLNIRLHDKAFIPAKSDVQIRKIVDYFNCHGNNHEMQEALYYAGSVYRDLNDTPRALAYFLDSKLHCETGEYYDTLMLRNTFSNLNCLYYQVQDYRNALYCAQKEYELSKQCNDMSATTIIHVVTSLDKLQRTELAKEKLIEALAYIKHSDANYFAQELYSMMYYFSRWKLEDLAQQCYSLATAKEVTPDFADAKLSLAEYFLLINKKDSASYYLQSVLKMPGNYQGKYDASKNLTNLYYEEGNDKLAAYYAKQFIKISDTLNLGERQRQAATVNNKFKYYQDEKKERELVEREQLYRQTAWGIATASAIVVLLLILFILYKRNVRLKLLLEKDMILKKANHDIKELEADISDRDCELNNLRNSLELTNKEMEEMNRKIKEAETELCLNEQLLSEKIKLNNTFIKLLHQTELEEKASDVIEATRNSANGQNQMNPENWKKLFRAVDELHPHFSEMLAEKLGRISEQEFHFCYLLRIGLSNTQIKNLTGLPRTTVWRWAKKYEWIANSYH